MARLFSITNDRKRDAAVAVEAPRRGGVKVHHVGPSGARARLERLVRSTDATSYEALKRRLETDEAVARALVDGDPEIPLSLVGSKLGRDAGTIFVDPDGGVLAVAHFLEVKVGPDGVETGRKEFVDVEATVGEEVGQSIVWTGRLLAKDEWIRKVGFTRVYQLRHVNGVTYDFLHAMAKTLADADKLLLVGAGEKGNKPLIFSTNGSSYRGFLEGRVQGPAYRLVLHLSNLEIKHIQDAP